MRSSVRSMSAASVEERLSTIRRIGAHSFQRAKASLLLRLGGGGGMGKLGGGGMGKLGGGGREGVWALVPAHHRRAGTTPSATKQAVNNRRRLVLIELFFQPLFLQICLCVFRARGIADRLHALKMPHPGYHDRSSIRSETSATRCIGGKCKLSARAATQKIPRCRFDVRKSCARVVSASLHAVTFDTIWSSEVRAIHSSRARLRLTHLCRDDQPNHVRTVVSSTLEIFPVDVVLMWY